MSLLSDNSLISFCLKGKQRYCRQIYERYKRLVKSIAWKYVKNDETVRDITQETFLKVYKNLEKFKGDSLFKTWLAKIAVNHCLDHIRKQNKSTKEESLDDPNMSGVQDIYEKKPVSNPETRLLQNELKKIVMSAIEKLGEKHKTVILLWHEGFSYTEIAEITKASEMVVGTRIFYAKNKLRKLLAPYMKGAGL